MIYLASPYTHADKGIMHQRFVEVERATAGLMAKRIHVYSPIVHCHELARNFSLPTDFDYWKSYNFDMIRRCDSFLILNIDGWVESKGVQGERKFAELCQLPTGLLNPRNLRTQSLLPLEE